MAEPHLRELTPDERVDYFRGVQPIWGGGLAEDRFIAFQRRLATSTEAAGRYQVLGLVGEGGELLSAVKAYDLRGEAASAPLRVLGIGAVFTPPELRKRGHAGQMLQLALDEWRRKGFDAALLFSDIGTEWYRRLGFVELESQECIVLPGALPRGQDGFRPAEPGDEVEMASLFSRCRRAGRSFALARDGWTLRFQLRRLRELARARSVGEPDWGVVVDGGRVGLGAAMVRQARDAIDVLDAGWESEGARNLLLSGLRDFLLRSGRPQLRFWPAHQLRGIFPSHPRATALAMVAMLRPGALPLLPNGSAADLSLLDHI